MFINQHICNIVDIDCRYLFDSKYVHIAVPLASHCTAKKGFNLRFTGAALFVLADALGDTAHVRSVCMSK